MPPNSAPGRAPTARDLAHAEVRRRILEAARRQVAAQGAGQLSLRGVVREVGMVSSAIYRYFPSRDALVTALLLESYDALAAALDAVRDGAAVDTGGGGVGEERRQRFVALARALVTWARERPAEFSLLYGTPVPGYVAPPETLEPATRVALPFLQVLAEAHRRGELSEPSYCGPLADQAEAFAVAVGLDLSPGAVVGFMAAMSLLVGALTLELDGHFVGSFDPGDALLDAVCERAASLAGFG